MTGTPLDLTPFGDLLKGIGGLHWLLMLALVALALWLPKRWWVKLPVAAAITALFTLPVRRHVDKGAAEASAGKARMDETLAHFEMRCKGAGEKITRTVENVDGMVWMKWRDKAEPSDDADQINGSSQADSMVGGGGNDGLAGGNGEDLIDGGAGNDLPLGGTGRDILLGGEGNDLIFGSAIGQFTMPVDVNFTPPQMPAGQLEFSRGFNWVGCRGNAPRMTADGTANFRFAEVVGASTGVVYYDAALECHTTANPPSHEVRSTPANESFWRKCA